MTLTIQFLLVSLLPLSFLGMALYLWRVDDERWQAEQRPLQSRRLKRRWLIALVMAALWSSSILRIYGGKSFPTIFVYNWRVMGEYFFSFYAILVLAVTSTYFTIPQKKKRITFLVSGIIFMLTLGLNPSIWGYSIPTVLVKGLPITHFDMWAAVWATSWLFPILSAWVLTYQTQTGIPHSLYRNQTRYWLLVLSFLMIGGLFAIIHAPAQPFWQQIGMVIIMLASTIGTWSIAQGHLPDLSITMRRLFGRTTGALVVFGLTWLALTFIIRMMTTLANGRDPYLILTVFAALFAAFFMFIYYHIDRVVSNYLLPTRYLDARSADGYGKALAALAKPEKLGQLFLEKVQTAVLTDNIWLFMVKDAPANRLILQPLTNIGEDTLPSTTDFAADSPFTTHWNHHKRPLSQFDINTLPDFSTIQQNEKNILLRWECQLYAPLYIADSMIGLLALGEKQTGDTYTRADFDKLAELADEIAPFLVQAEQHLLLQGINQHAFHENQTLAREKQHLQELAELYAQFLSLITPELRRPFTPISEQIQLIDEQAGNQETRAALFKLKQHTKQAQTDIEQLVNMSSRIQARGEFYFEMVRLDDIVLITIRKLQTMADARRVSINFEPEAALPHILGDKEQLGEAVKNLLHNAIKFNKIGGRVDVTCTVEGRNVQLQISDIGVGISPERMDQLWSGFSSLDNKERRSGGRGLGLSLTQFIVTAHSGTISAHSEYGVGSTFIVLLPIVYEDN